MKKAIILLCIIAAANTAAFAQYVSLGKIEYERKVNVYAQMEEMADDGDNSWLEMIKSKVPKFNVSYFDLLFDTSRSIYKPGREVEGNTFKMWGGGPATENVVLTDFHSKIVKANKRVYDQVFIQQDSIRQLRWKMVDEIRTIAGYKCRKAVSKICDSVYVVAFFTDDIEVSGGPEMFAGLPGMILELAVPRLHTTWTATKVEFIAPQETDYKVSEKGKVVSTKEMVGMLQSSFKSWGKMANRNIWWVTL